MTQGDEPYKEIKQETIIQPKKNKNKPWCSRRTQPEQASPPVQRLHRNVRALWVHHFFCRRSHNALLVSISVQFLHILSCSISSFKKNNHNKLEIPCFCCLKVWNWKKNTTRTLPFATLYRNCHVPCTNISFYFQHQFWTKAELHIMAQTCCI